jgi:hypothetical protein
LQTNSKVLRWTLNTKLAIADELIARRLTLFEAAAGFREVSGALRGVALTLTGRRRGSMSSSPAVGTRARRAARPRR